MRDLSTRRKHNIPDIADLVSVSHHAITEPKWQDCTYKLVPGHFSRARFSPSAEVQA